MTEEWESAPDTVPHTCKHVSPLVSTRAYTKRNHSIYISCEETNYTYPCVCLFSHIKVCTYADNVQEKERWGRFWTVEGGSNRWSEKITQKLHSLYSKPNISSMIRTMRMRWAGHLLCMWCRQMHTGFWKEAWRKTTSWNIKLGR